MTELRPFHPDDVKPLLGREWYGRLFQDALKSYATGPAFTLLRDGYLVGSAGIVLPYPRFGEAWAILNPYYHRPFTVHRTVKRVMWSLARELNLRRLQMCVDTAADLRYHKWPIKLGFHQSGILEKYGPKGEDFVLYVLFPAPEE